jgi:hypothetical protein
VTKAHRFNPSSTAEQSNHRVLGIGRHNRHVVGQSKVGLGGRVVEDQTRQGASAALDSRTVALIMDRLVIGLHCRVIENCTIVRRCGIGMERRRKLEKQGSQAEMNLHGQKLERVTNTCCSTEVWTHV